MTLLRGQIQTLSEADGFQLGWASALSLGLTIWSARVAIGALIRGLNAIYHVPNRSGVSHTLRALLLTLCLIGVALVALLSVVVTPLVSIAAPQWALSQGMVLISRWGLTFGVLLAGFAVVYRLGPNRSGMAVWPGAFAVTCVWAGASAGFSIYLANFEAYAHVQGSIGAVVALLLWLYLSAYLVLMGAALNAWLTQRNQPEPNGQDRAGRRNQHG
jgi:membrane protein